jgi:glutathione synthase/RimK-type ligase-like ATP-grasp enzyme
MILIVTNRTDYTADFLILELRKRNVDYVRFNTEDYPQTVKVCWELNSSSSEGYFEFPKRKVYFREIKSVWYRRPVSPVPSEIIHDPVDREFAIAESKDALDGIWRILDCYWVSDPDNLRKAEFKLFQLKIATSLGFMIPTTIVTNIPHEATNFFENSQGRIIYKPLRRGRIVRGEEVGLIYTNPVESSMVDEFKNIFYCPTLLQRNIGKDVEIRVTIIQNVVFAVEIHSQEFPDTKHDWRHGDTTRLIHKTHILPNEIEKKCIDLVKQLGLNFGAIDLILDTKGEYIFLEINPNGQWAWIQQLNPEINIRGTLADLLIAMGQKDEISDK